MNNSIIYKIGRGYSCLTVWQCDGLTRERQSISTCRPLKKFGRRQRWEVLAQRLFELRVTIPAYKPSKREVA